MGILVLLRILGCQSSSACLERSRLEFACRREIFEIEVDTSYFVCEKRRSIAELLHLSLHILSLGSSLFALRILLDCRKLAANVVIGVLLAVLIEVIFT